MPPSYGVPSGPSMSASHRKRSSSDTGPAVMPSGGSWVRVLYSENSRFEATEVVDMLEMVLWKRTGWIYDIVRF